MKLLVVSLDRERERRAAVRRRFAALGLDPEIFPAVDGLDLTAEQRAIVDSRARFLRTPFAMGGGTIGCLWSHIGVLRRCAGGPDDMLAAFEDDAAPSSRLPEALAAIERLGPRFDFVKLYHTRKGLRVAPCRDIGGFTLGRPRFHDVGMVGYVVSRGGARRTLEQMKKWPFEIDTQLSRWWDHGIDYFSIDPPVVEHDDGGLSSIRMRDGEPLRAARGLAWYLRRRAFRLRDSLTKRAKFARWVADGRRRLNGSRAR